MRYFLSILLLLAACSHPKIDQTKFERLYRAGKAVEMSNLWSYSPELRRAIFELEIEAATAAGLARTETERDLAYRYQKASAHIGLAKLKWEYALVRAKGANWSGPEFDLAIGEWNQGEYDLKQAAAYYLNPE